MKVVCAWCKSVIVGAVPRDGEPVSHGMCRRCAQRQLREMAASWSVEMIDGEAETMSREFDAAMKRGEIDEAKRCLDDLGILAEEKERRQQNGHEGDHEINEGR